MSSLTKILKVLDLFGPDCTSQEVENIAVRMGISRATAYRYVGDLCKTGLLTKLDDFRYGLGPRIIELDWKMRQSDPMLTVGRKYLQELSEQTGLTVFSSVYYDGHIINTHIEEPIRQYRFAFGRGRPLPIFSGAQSKILVSYQKGTKLKRIYETQIANNDNYSFTWKEFLHITKKIRDDGFCITHDELNLGLTGIAAPIFVGPEKKVTSSLAVVGNTDNFRLLKKECVAELVKETAEQIALKL